jgi:hypothetical protein
MDQLASFANTSTLSASCAGLTRASIILRKNLSRKMDCRVKPGNDVVGGPGNDGVGGPGSDGAI